MEKLDIKAFRKANNLTQSALGSYLGIDKCLISAIEHGKSKLPKAKLGMIVHNPHNWDITMLTKSAQPIQPVVKIETDKVRRSKLSGSAQHFALPIVSNTAKSADNKEIERLWFLIEEQREDIKALMDIAKKYIEENRVLRQEIEQLKNKIESRDADNV
jgi:transcriptional regulator with XRE-family HTH domain